MTLCRSASLIQPTDTTIAGHPLYCKCWRCDICGPRNARRVARLALAGRPTTLITLTTNPNVEPDPDRAAELLLAAFQTFVRVIRRRYGRDSFEYLRVWEATKRGMPHLHVIARCPFIPQAEISAYFDAHIGAPIVDIRRVDSERRVVQYVAKYLSKDVEWFQGRTRYARSHNWIVDPTYVTADANDPDAPKWIVVHTPLDRLANELERRGWLVEYTEQWMQAYAPTGPPPGRRADQYDRITP